MGGFLNFDKMITPILITFFFWVGVLFAIVGGFISIGIGIFSDSGNFIQVTTGIIMILFGPIIIRIYCEMFIVLFKMQAALVQIRDMQKPDSLED